MVSQRVARHVSFACMFVGFVLCVVATATEYWHSSTIPNSGMKMHMGLWKLCTPKFGGMILCADNAPLLGGWVDACRAFMVIACLGYAAALLYCVILHIKKDWSVKIMGVILLLTALSTLIGMVIFAIKGSPFGWSFIVGWISILFSVVAAALTFSDSGYSSLA